MSVIHRKFGNKLKPQCYIKYIGYQFRYWLDRENDCYSISKEDESMFIDDEKTKQMQMI